MKLDVVGLIGDVHGEDILLEKTIQFMKSKNIKHILCVGDIVDGGNDVNRCCEILQSEKIISVSGNHDRWFLSNTMRQLKKATLRDSLTQQSRSFLKSLPSTFKFSTPQGLALLCHGLDRNDMAIVKPDDYGYAIEVNKDLQKLINKKKYKFVLNGHSHCQMIRSFQNLTIINAGTLKRKHNPGFVTVDLNENHAYYYNFIERDSIEIEQKINLLNI